MTMDLTKKTKMVQGQSGDILDIKPDGSINVNAVISVGLKTPVDIRPAPSLDLNPVTYVEIVKYLTVPGKPLKIQELTVSLLGMSGHFVLEYYNGTITETIREYWLNNPSAPFTERLGTELSIPHTPDAYVRWTARLNGVGQEGKGYAIINGYN